MTLTQINKAGLDEIALDHVFTIGASGTDHYTFQGEGLNGTVNDPTLYLTRGKTYRFENTTGAHAIRIQSADNGTSGTLYNTGVTNNNTTGTVIVEVQHDAPDVLYYQCASHANMKGTLYITGALADGGVSTAKLADDAVTAAKLADNAVVTANIADDAVTNAKIGAGAVGTGEIADNAILSNKIAANQISNSEIASTTILRGNMANNSVGTTEIIDEAVTLAKLEHGTSSNDGKFLRANNGADPTFETVTSTTINNNANNRIITGSNSADTLEGEANFTYNGTMLEITGSDQADLLQLGTGNNGGNIFAGMRGDNEAGIRIRGGGSQRGGEIDLGGGTRNTDPAVIKFSTTSGTSFSERMRIDASGRVGIGETSPDGDLHIKSSNPAIYLEDSTNSSQHGQAIIEQNGDNLKIRQDAGNASSGSGSNISFQVDAAERVKIANLGDNEYGFKFLNSKAVEFKDSNMEICTLTWSISANTWTNFFSASQNHMSWLFLNSIHNSGNSSALWALSDSWSGGSSYATRKIHQNNYSPADIDIQRNGVWWQIKSGYGTYGYAILMVNTGAGSVANLLG